jgi:hypothetical protein
MMTKSTPVSHISHPSLSAHPSIAREKSSKWNGTASWTRWPRRRQPQRLNGVGWLSIHSSLVWRICVDLKHRFKAKSEKLKAKPIFKTTRERQAEKYEQAPELPTADSAAKPKKDPKDEMESFLDDLLS